MTVKVLKFAASWCGPCKVMAPMFDKVAEEFDDVKFEECDIDEYPEIATAFGIKAVPTMVILKDERVVDTIVGMVKEDDLRERVKAAM